MLEIQKGKKVNSSQTEKEDLNREMITYFNEMTTNCPWQGKS